MNWNYRIVLHNDVEHPYFAVHEVFYDDNGNITHWTENPATFIADEDEWLTTVIDSLRQALADVERTPMLTASALPGGGRRLLDLGGK